MEKDFKICISLGHINKAEILNILSEVEMAEIRLDLLELNENDIISVFKEHNLLIATCREGLNNNTNRAKILETAIKAGAAYVDIEADAKPEWRKKMSEIARNNNCKIIYSYHCYTHTPPLEELKKIINSIVSEGADFIKIATKSNEFKDNSRLLSLYLEYDNLITVGMGTKGIITRFASPFLGAPFTFASFGAKQTAPGQVDYFEMKNIINTLLNL